MKSTTSRRSVLQSAALPAINLMAVPPVKPKVVVVGAGAFGGWTALHLLRMGCLTSYCWAEVRVMATSTGPRSANARPAFCWGKRAPDPFFQLAGLNRK
jgi:glycine/D-amino acid oxidase-like deaminating enzyme